VQRWAGQLYSKCGASAAHAQHVASACRARREGGGGARKKTVRLPLSTVCCVLCGF
jgi:hypothetical protein